jgi:uncharacterized protein (DUF1330 family)
MSSYLVYICQAVKDRAGQERYWEVAPAVYPKNIDVLAGYGPFEVLDADQDERVEGVVIAEFPPFEQTVEWFNSDAYVQCRKHREANEFLGMLVESGVAPISNYESRRRALSVDFAASAARNHQQVQRGEPDGRTRPPRAVALRHSARHAG